VFGKTIYNWPLPALLPPPNGHLLSRPLSGLIYVHIKNLLPSVLRMIWMPWTYLSQLGLPLLASWPNPW
jgi:hypothetical protein